MERVWKEMNLGSILEFPEDDEQGEREMLLQDFLAGEVISRSSGIPPGISDLLRRPVPPPAATASPTTTTATTLLSLNSGCNEMHYLDWLGGFDSKRAAALSSSLHHPNMVESPGFGPFCRKRGGAIDGDGSIDRRQKRVIKNRESAARSRARKQAYTNELEIEMAHLIEENMKLRQQQNQLHQMQQEQQVLGNPAAGSGSRGAGAKSKPVLRRTSTAPF